MELVKIHLLNLHGEMYHQYIVLFNLNLNIFELEWNKASMHRTIIKLK